MRLYAMQQQDNLEIQTAQLNIEKQTLENYIQQMRGQ
jgi:hypothetical protein